MKTVLIPEENAKDLVEIPDSVQERDGDHPVSRMDEVLAGRSRRKPEPIEWDEAGVKPVPAPAAVEVDEEASVLTAH